MLFQALRLERPSRGLVVDCLRPFFASVKTKGEKISSLPLFAERAVFLVNLWGKKGEEK